MRLITIKEYEAGQRLDRYLSRYMKEASKGFLYKMLRKKNITLNEKKADGTEVLHSGDEIRLFLAEETLEKFMGEPAPASSGSTKVPTRTVNTASHRSASGTSVNLSVIYEDSDVIFINKPAGMLSQKAKPEDVSVCEHLTDRMIRNGEITEEALRTFRPGVCNRLDRNTSGIIAAGKSIRGLQVLSELFRSRGMEKYYLCIVHGNVSEGKRVEGYLYKDEAANTVSVSDQPGGDRIVTEYQPLDHGSGYTLLRVQLITGKTHQIRAHLASEGFPILGDSKYGDLRLNQDFRKEYPLRCQLLHSWKLVFPGEVPGLINLAGKTVTAPVPPHFGKVLRLLGMRNPV